MTRVSRSSEVSRALCMHAYLTCQEEAGVITETETESQVSSFSICLSIHSPIHPYLSVRMRARCAYPSILSPRINIILPHLARSSHPSLSSCVMRTHKYKQRINIFTSPIWLDTVGHHSLFTSYFIMRSPDEGVTKTDEELYFYFKPAIVRGLVTNPTGSSASGGTLFVWFQIDGTALFYHSKPVRCSLCTRLVSVEYWVMATKRLAVKKPFGA